MKKLIIIIIILTLLAVVMIAGCTSEEKPITEISIPGHGTEVYTFYNDIHKAVLVKTNDPQGIKAIGDSFTKMNIVFDGSSTQDNGYFRAILISILAKVPIYYSYEGRIVHFDSYYFIGDKWYNSTSEEIEKPVFQDPVLWLSGPSTGANETSVILNNNTIYLNGDSYKGLTMASDKLVLLFFGINKV